jgi:hypothetical protein
LLGPDSLDDIRYRILADRREHEWVLHELDSVALPHGGYRSYGSEVERDLAVHAAMIADTWPGARVVIVVEGKCNVIGFVHVRCTRGGPPPWMLAEPQLNSVSALLVPANKVREFEWNRLNYGLAQNFQARIDAQRIRNQREDRKKLKG